MRARPRRGASAGVASGSGSAGGSLVTIVFDSDSASSIAVASTTGTSQGPVLSEAGWPVASSAGSDLVEPPARALRRGRPLCERDEHPRHRHHQHDPHGSEVGEAGEEADEQEERTFEHEPRHGGSA